MNLSGGSIRGIVGAHRIPKENVLVVYDDSNLPLGTIRVRVSTDIWFIDFGVVEKNLHRQVAVAQSATARKSTAALPQCTTPAAKLQASRGGLSPSVRFAALPQNTVNGSPSVSKN